MPKASRKPIMMLSLLPAIQYAVDVVVEAQQPIVQLDIRAGNTTT